MRRLSGVLRNPACVAWLLAVLALAAGMAWVELFERLHEFSRAHEDWQMDEVFSVLIVVSFIAPVLLWRWNRALVLAHRHTTEAEAEAQRIAFHDPLTGMPNRRSFHRHVEERAALAWSGERARAMTVLLLDLDRFKPVNDLRGHQSGDRLLCEVARRLRRVCPEEALVARLGGDEFVIALDGPEAEGHGGALARRVNATLAEPFDFGDWSASISCSIGIAEWEMGMSSVDLLRHADQAMYRAKQAGRGGHARYDEALGEALREQAALEQDLRRAVEQGTIEPYFQPIYDITGQELRSFEVLARWPHPQRGFVAPDVFIALAEEIGIIDQLSDLMLDRACAALARWRTEVPLSFNLSPRQFADRGLPQRILAILERHGLKGERLEIEITERAVLADMEIARGITEELAAAGVRISLDDFGTGTSSLALLTRLPFHRIKIDRNFIADVDLLPDRGKIVSGVLALAESLGLDVTAEGIERIEELAFLRERRCALAQGYLLGHPQPAESVPGLLLAAVGPGVVSLRAQTA